MVMVLVKYKAGCPFCTKLQNGEIEMRYRKDKKFNVRNNNKNVHICNNEKCGKEFVVEIDSAGKVVAMPTKKAEEEGIFAWEKLMDGTITEVVDN